MIFNLTIAEKLPVTTHVAITRIKHQNTATKFHIWFYSILKKLEENVLYKGHNFSFKFECFKLALYC